VKFPGDFAGVRYGVVMRTVRCRETYSGDPYCPREAVAVVKNTVIATPLTICAGFGEAQSRMTS
jgi:hypothetical protein